VIGIITVGVDVIVKGMGTLMQANAELAKLRGERAAGGAATTFQGADRQTVLNAQKQARQTLQAIEAERKQSKTPGARLQQLATGALGIVAPMVGLPSQEEMAARPALMKAREQKARDILALPVPAAAKPPQLPQLPQPPTLDTGTGGNGKAKKPEKSLQQQVAELTAIKQIEQDISNARLAGNEVLQAQLEAYKRQLEIKHQGLAPELEALELERNGIQLNETLAELEKERLERFNQFLTKEDERIEKQMGIIKNYQEETRMLELQAVKGQEFVDKLKQIKTLVEEGGMSFAQAFDEVNRRAAALKQKVDPLKDVFEQMASTVATTFSSAFDAAVDGTENLGEALQGLAADLLKTIGKMLIMYGIAQALGAAGGGAGNPEGILSFLARGFGYRASGGPISPGGTYIVGENGPEVLQMNRDGSGQVINNNQLSSAMNRYRRSGSGATTAAGGTTEAPGGGVAVADKPIDVRYTVERINNVDYVTAEQFQQGMRQAAQQGASQGERRTIQKLQMSPGTRRRLGL
jgi:hypothetical protein